MELRKLSKMCLEARMPRQDQRLLLMPDVHWDNPKCDRDVFNKLMKQAVQQKAMVCFFGDFFCLMQGRYDPRRSRNGIRPEHNKSNYLDLVINDAAEQLAPYANNILFFGEGNHESKIRDHIETDVLERLIERINAANGSQIAKMGYHGFVWLKMGNMDGQGGTVSKVLAWHHGAYGGAVTRGTLGVNRHGLVMPDADIIVTGHTHDHWSTEVPRFRLKQNGDVKVETQIHLKVGTLKEEFATDGGWAVEKLVMPKALKGWWLDLIHYRDQPSKQHCIQVSYSPAY